MDPTIKVKLQKKSMKTGVCAVCGKPYKGIFMWSCTNPGCELYDYFASQNCGICGQKRYDCAC